MLHPGGAYVLVGHEHYGFSGGRWIGRSLARILRLLVLSPFVSQLSGPSAADPGDRLGLLNELIEAGRLAPVVDRTYPLEEVPQAIRSLEQGRVRGKVVIMV